jgi:hypothetical protein
MMIWDRRKWSGEHRLNLEKSSQRTKKTMPKSRAAEYRTAKRNNQPTKYDSSLAFDQPPRNCRRAQHTHSSLRIANYEFLLNKWLSDRETAIESRGGRGGGVSLRVRQVERSHAITGSKYVPKLHLVPNCYRKTAQ